MELHARMHARGDDDANTTAVVGEDIERHARDGLLWDDDLDVLMLCYRHISVLRLIVRLGQPIRLTCG